MTWAIRSDDGFTGIDPFNSIDGDANCDGITNADALAIQKKLLKLD